MTLKYISFIFCVLGLILLSMAGIRIVQKRYQPHPEWSRKLMHMAGGLIALTFPFLFLDSWPVAMLCLLTIAGLFTLKTLPNLKETIGSVISAVNRSSSGDIYFSAGVGILFFLSGDDPLLYCVPLLILTFADAAAALAGAFYGRHHHQLNAHHKSIEGSIAFFMTAFLCTNIPLLLFSDTARAEIVIISFLLSLLLAIIEAITAWDGFDNLLIPLLGYIFLKGMLDSELTTLVIHASAVTAALALNFCFQFRSPFIGPKLLKGVVLGYLCWLFRCWRWVSIPLIHLLSNPYK